MSRDKQHNPDPNENAARIVAESAGIGPQRGPASVPQIKAQTAQLTRELEIETAWKEWSASIQRVDERGMTLLKAAFEAGWDAGKNG